ncbi:hypothetical protein JVT61DRAFT_7153 [Boletus reticuloceps]|uniref:DUF202 domain-containing protein n=1 Tax=Boletus reticuloceps TaxID=495285 RepID=A0A8I3A777_9AGAM|nr:hypothetical protein JVT61DRAFT_7153 [Boletus reticuloceps]
MPIIERHVSTEQMPPLEPLTDPSSDASVLHDDPAALRFPPTLPLVVSPPESVAPSAPKDKLDWHVGQRMKGLTAPLGLSLVLENKGNVARDHLASERTYLAYVRTSLATASAGVALVQLFSLSSSKSLTKFAKPLGATIILFSLIILVLGVFRYFVTQSSLVRGYFPVARKSIAAVAFVLGTLVGIVFGVLVAGTQR